MKKLGELMATRQAVAVQQDNEMTEEEKASDLKSKIKDLTGRMKGFFKI